jgi:hypothetical protein
MDKMDKKTLLTGLCAATLLVGLSAAPAPAATSRPTLTGSVAYAEPVAWDYDKDGSNNQVQMWASFDIKGPVGTKGTPDYLAGGGTMRRFIKDLGTGKPVAGYGIRNMLPDTPLGQPIEVSDVEFKDRRMQFTVEGYRYTVTDGGPGYENDKVVLDNGLEEYPVTLFAGDLTITGKQ